MRRGPGTGFKRGADHHLARLPTETVIAMREARKLKGTPYSQLAVEFGCSKWTVRDIVEYRTRVDG